MIKEYRVRSVWSYKTLPQVEFFEITYYDSDVMHFAVSIARTEMMRYAGREIARIDYNNCCATLGMLYKLLELK